MYEMHIERLSNFDVNMHACKENIYVAVTFMYVISLMQHLNVLILVFKDHQQRIQRHLRPLVDGLNRRNLKTHRKEKNIRA